MKPLKLLVAVILLSTINLWSNEWKIYIDADFSNATESSRSIQMGIELALKKYLPQNYTVSIVPLDHRGNSRRSLKNLETFKNDDQGIVIFCGLHSPPVLANLSYINTNKIVLLDPWAAATPITRTPDENGENWIFRLSIDDSKAGEVITDYSFRSEGFTKPLLLLEDTGWGRANELTFKKAIKDRDLIPPQTLWFDWQLGNLGAKQILSDILAYNPDTIFLVANAIEGEILLREISYLDSRIPVRSHWGITGGDLFNKITDILNSNRLDLKFIQTSFLFTNSKLTTYQSQVWNDIKQHYPHIDNQEDLKAPLGLIHSYDLTKIFIEALKNIESNTDIKTQRDQLRYNLESLSIPVEGLIKTYIQPFSSSNHEALGSSDFSMAQYTEKGAIELVD